MKPSWWDDVEPAAKEAIEEFSGKLKNKLQLPPEKIITRKNPFLFRVRVVSSVHEYAGMVIDAHLSSSEETMFGNVLEKIAVTVCEYAKDGRKSGIPNIDLEYDQGQTRTIMQIKSGTNWGNSNQHNALKATFATATKVLRQGSPNLNVRCIEGICYGRSEIKDKGTHVRIVGNCFWEDISDWDGTAGMILELLGRHASNGLLDVRQEARTQMVDFLSESGVVSDNGSLRWDKLLELVMEG